MLARSELMSDRSDDHKRTKLGRILLSRRLVSPEDLDDALHRQRHDGSRLATLVADLGAAEAGALVDALGEQQGTETVDLSRAIFLLEHLRLVPEDIARQHHVLPLSLDGEVLTLAMADPHDRRVIDEVELVTGKRVEAVVALDGLIASVIPAAYAALLAGQVHFAGAQAESGSIHDYRPSGSPGLSGRPESEPPLDKSTRFDDELSRPLVSILPANGLRPSEPMADGTRLDVSRKTRILVVDDTDDIRQLLVRVFRERDFEVVESASGLDALDKVRASTPDVIVLDAMLPEVHGFDICRRIKASRRYGHIPVVMVSAVYRGWRFADDLKRAYGVDAFLEKPFRIADMLAVVERALLGGGHLDADVAPPEELEPACAELLRASSEAYARGDAEGAIAQLKGGIAQHPMAFRLHYHLGLLYGKLDYVFDAIHVLETAAELRPRDFSTHKNLAVLYQRAGFRLKATEMWERALGSAPDDETRANIKNHLVSLF
jgi:DNA-binding response OmpR family regulator